MDPVSIGIIIGGSVLFVGAYYRIHELEKEVGALNRIVSEISAKVNSPDSRVSILELEHRTIKAEIAEIKAIRRAEFERARQPLRPGSFRAFRNQLQGAEIEPK